MKVPGDRCIGPHPGHILWTDPESEVGSMLTLTAGPGIRLQLFEKEHASHLYHVIDANRQHLRSWLPWTEGIRNVPDAERYILRSLARYTGGYEAHFGIWLQGCLAGSVTAERIDEGNRVAEIGYWLAQKFTGRGVMTRAVSALIQYLFSELGLNRIEIRCEEDNGASQAVPRRLGFRLEGTLRQAGCKEGRFVDHLIFGLLASEWSP